MVEILSDKERAAFSDDMAIVVQKTIDSMVTIADKHNVDRDNAIQFFAEIFGTMADVSTFQNWGESSG